MLSLDTNEGDFDFFTSKAFLCSWCHFTEVLCRFLSCGRGCAFASNFSNTLFKARKMFLTVKSVLFTVRK